MEHTETLKARIREVLDFPTDGVQFKDITPLLEDPQAFRDAVDALVEFFKEKQVDKVVGIDARGFLFASVAAYLLGAGMVIIRKKGKLPWKKIFQHHGLEYGKGRLELHIDSIKKGERVAVIDDVLATGGTAEAAVRLVEQLGGVIVGVGFLAELVEFGGRERIKQYPIYSVLLYPQ